MVALATIRDGELARIISFKSEQIVRNQLQYLGLMEGDLLRVIQNNRGNMIISRGTLRLALVRGTGKKIFVEKISAKR